MIYLYRFVYLVTGFAYFFYRVFKSFMLDGAIVEVENEPKFFKWLGEKTEGK